MDMHDIPGIEIMTKKKNIKHQSQFGTPQLNYSISHSICKDAGRNINIPPPHIEFI